MRKKKMLNEPRIFSFTSDAEYTGRVCLSSVTGNMWFTGYLFDLIHLALLSPGLLERGSTYATVSLFILFLQLHLISLYLEAT